MLDIAGKYDNLSKPVKTSLWNLIKPEYAATLRLHIGWDDYGADGEITVRGSEITQRLPRGSALRLLHGSTLRLP